MTKTDWQRIEEIFGEALKLEPDVQSSYLDTACDGNADWRRRVETLLRAHVAAEGFLEEAAPIPASPEAGASLPAPLAAGDRLGPYRVLRRLGEGGMGTVFLAERDDGAFTRQVAVKVLRGGTESPAAVERLERERHILAGLDHPGIARLLDGGTTAAGLPYVVMELVDGEPIDQACERQQLSPAARVDLMLEVADAVTAAHRNLVVHRDLKPSNILIDADGRPRLLDFGIAKLLEPGKIGAEPTASWERRLTPSYASPEQLRGERVTVAADAYQLGVVLYKLLTGRMPHSFEGCSLLEVERIVTHETPRRPSEHVPELDADLDAIVLKALRANPGERYGSVDDLAADLRRHRDGLPVLARQGNTRYLAGKFLRRHWLPLGTALLIVLLVGAFAISTAAQARRIERTLGRLVAVEGFLVDLFWSAGPEAAKGRVILVQEVLQRGERRLDEGKVAEPGSRGLLHALFGRIALHLDQPAKAREHLEKALLAYEKVDDDPYLEAVQARTQSDLAMTYLEEDIGEAETLALAALERGRTLLSRDRGSPPGSPQGDPEGLLELLNHLTTIYCWQRKWDEARPLSDEANALLAGREDTLSSQTAVMLSTRALLFKNHVAPPLESPRGDQAGKTEEARRFYEEALGIFRRLEGDVHPEIANILNQLGLLSRDGGDLETAVSHFQESLDVRRVLYPGGHWEIGQSLYQLGMVHRKAGNLLDAEGFMKEALDAYVRERGPTFSRTIFLLAHLAEIHVELGRAEEAREMLAGLPPEFWTERAPDSPLLAIGRRALGCTLVAQGQWEEAEGLLSPSLDVLRGYYGDESWEAELARDCLERVREARGRAAVKKIFRRLIKSLALCRVAG